MARILVLRSLCTTYSEHENRGLQMNKSSRDETQQGNAGQSVMTSIRAASNRFSMWKTKTMTIKMLWSTSANGHKWPASNSSSCCSCCSRVIRCLCRGESAVDATLRASSVLSKCVFQQSHVVTELSCSP